MSTILVCPAEHAASVAAEFGPSHVLGMRSSGDAASDQPPHPEVPAGGRPRRTHDRRACCEAELRSAPQHEDEGRPAPRGARRDATLALTFHDIAEPRPGLVPPGPADVDAILRFGRAWPGKRPLLIHCRMGISRSTAAAFAIACDLAPSGTEPAIAAALRAAAPCATPNPLLVALADAALGRDGRMVAAIAAIGRGADYRPYRVFALRAVDPSPRPCAARRPD